MRRMETGDNPQNPCRGRLEPESQGILTQKTPYMEGCLPTGASAPPGRVLDGHTRLPLSLNTTGIPLSSLASNLAGMDLLASHSAGEPTPPGRQGDLISSSSHATFSGFLTGCLCVRCALGVNVSAVGTELATHCPLAMVPTQDGHL